MLLCGTDWMKELIRGELETAAFIHSFIHSFKLFLWRLFKSTATTTQRRSRPSMNTASDFHADAPKATASEELAQVLYVAARADSNQRPFGHKATNLPMSHPAPQSVDLQNCSLVEQQQPRHLGPTITSRYMWFGQR